MKTRLAIMIFVALLGGCLFVFAADKHINDDYTGQEVQPPAPVSDSVTPPQVTVTEITVTPEPEIVTVYEPVQLKEFVSPAELKHFITWTWASSPEYLELKDTQDYNTPGKCELWAVGCQKFAQSQGYRINFQVAVCLR